MSISVEYEAARSRVALSLRPRRSLAAVEGDARVTFLQGMLSNDIQSRSPGEGCRALLLDTKGKVQADLDLWVDTKTIIMGCDSDLLGGALETLRKYVLAAPVEFVELDQRFCVLGLTGPGVLAGANTASAFDLASRARTKGSHSQ